ncbi:uncharacterized protein LOC135693223 [Rhopilema esculentum]|uniref:uncharacterized protein LOC135693223 n=1 Tax=Rhopilema esculentum TaxID=499914 RepID=UPI0031CDEEC3
MISGIAMRAGISVSHFSRISITWLDLCTANLEAIPFGQQTKLLQEHFKKVHPATRVIIDCIEFFIEKPSSIQSQSASYSHYKHHNTAKGLIGITPSGAVSFVSDLYTERTSDKQATKDYGIYNLLEPGNAIMADKGFDIQNDFPAGVSLNILPFLRNKDHLSLSEKQETRNIATLRIHVERAIARIKTFSVLKTVFPISMCSELNKIWVICAYLTNFVPSLISTDE